MLTGHASNTRGAQAMQHQQTPLGHTLRESLLSIRYTPPIGQAYELRGLVHLHCRHSRCCTHIKNRTFIKLSQQSGKSTNRVRAAVYYETNC